MGMEIPQGDINTNLITYTITSILTHTQHHKLVCKYMSRDVGVRSTRPLGLCQTTLTVSRICANLLLERRVCAPVR